MGWPPRGQLMAGRLTVCPTPIGNMADLSARAPPGARRRRPGRLRGHPSRRAALRAPRDHPAAAGLQPRGNEAERAVQLAQQIERGARVALITDAGTPVISDPGYRLIAACIERGLEVEVLPGPDAVTTALVASGLPAHRWRFEGFLPRRAGELERVLSSARDGDRLRVPAPPARLAGGARGARARPPGGDLPRVDQAPRGGRPRGRWPSSRGASAATSRARSWS